MMSLSSKISSGRKRLLKPASKQKIMVFGTFDVLHKGHDHFFRQARGLAGAKRRPFLVVSVARDKNVKRIKRQVPLYGESRRLAAVKAHRLVDRAVMGADGNHVPHIVREKPELIALGYDQRNYVRGLKAALKEKGLDVKIVRLKPHQPHKYKSSIVKKQLLRKSLRAR